MKLWMGLVLGAGVWAAPLTLLPGEVGFQRFTLYHVNPERSLVLTTFNPEDVGGTVEIGVDGEILTTLPIFATTQTSNGSLPYPIGAAGGEVLWIPPPSEFVVQVTNRSSIPIHLRAVNITTEGRIAAGWMSVGGVTRSGMEKWQEPQVSSAPNINNPEPGTVVLVGVGIVWLIGRRLRLRHCN